MGKTKRGEREFGREKRLSHENKRLKKELAQLRKLLARVDLDRYSQVKEIIQEHCQDERAQEGQDLLDRMKEEWRCTGTPGCEGYLEIIIFNKVDSTYYFRRCNCCDNRTKSQRYSPEVKGIIKKIS